MNTSLERRRRRRRAAGSRGGGAAGRIAAAALLAIPLLLFAGFAALAALGFTGVVIGYQVYSEGLPDPKEVFTNLEFNEGSSFYDRAGKVRLAGFALERRDVVTFDEIPAVAIDATTAIEDKTFWENAGFDPIGIISAGIDSLRGNERGASTITQQLVRARLLPDWAFEGSRYDRKIREIIQSIRLTQEFPGREGKKSIMAAYLNQNFYGNQSYGIKAAAQGYFGLTDLSKMTLAQAAILAAIPQSPSRYDLLRNAVEQPSPDGKSTILVVPPDSPVVQRRNYVLDLMKTRSELTAGQYSAADYDAAMREPVILTLEKRENWNAPHFVWQARHQLGEILCGPDQADNCRKIDTGGYRVLTTLNWTMQTRVEKWVKGAIFAPQQSTPAKTAAYLKSLGLPNASWIQNLRRRNVNNGAAAAMDYRTGEVLAYVGSADYYFPRKSKVLQPQFDVLSDGWRQPGSAIKPLNYITGLEDRTMTAATLFMDVVTDFTGKGYKPTQADDLERGPVRLRSALQFSLNVPAIKASYLNGLNHLMEATKAWGISYQRGAAAVPSMALGTLETHPMDLINAYAGIANSGTLMPRTYILSVFDSDGKQVWPAPGVKAKGKKVASPEAAYIIADILKGNTDPKVNPYWGKWAVTDKGKRRPAAYKTGTNSDTKDLGAYGFLAPPRDAKAPALVVGVWLGNSDNSPTRDVLSIDAAAPLWDAIISDLSAGTPITDFPRPKNIVEGTVDAASGYLPGPFTSKKVKEIFIKGTVPTTVDFTKYGLEVDKASGKLWQEGCVGPKVTRGFLDLSQVEAAFPRWQKANRSWLARAARGPGVRGPEGTRTSYFYLNSFAPFGRTWGAPFAPRDTCDLAPVETPQPSEIPGESPAPSP